MLVTIGFPQVYDILNLFLQENNVIELGQYSSLKVVKILTFGAYLDADDEEILLPIREVPEGTAIGDTLQVYIYKDSENRVIASTKTAKIFMNQYACLRVMDTNKYGAFLDWGMDNQLLVPFREQHTTLIKGKSYVVKLYLDTRSDRLAATSKIEKHLLREVGDDVTEEAQVELLVYGQMDTAYKVVVNQKYAAMLYKNEVFQPVNMGDVLIGYVKKIRPDRKLDVMLRNPGPDEYEKCKAILLEKLLENQGFLGLNDNSSPEKIKSRLNMSKRTFKKTVGALYKERRIEITEAGIQMLKPE